MATIWQSGLLRAARKTKRRMRPKPLIPILVVLQNKTTRVSQEGEGDREGAYMVLMRVRDVTEMRETKRERVYL